MNYALIRDGRVQNILWLYAGNAAEFPDAVPCLDVPAAIGDTYAQGIFYRDGKRVLTALEAAQEEAQSMREALQLLGVNADE